MSDFKPMGYFLLITLLISTLLTLTYDAFDITIDTILEEDLPAPIKTYFDIKTFIDGFSTIVPLFGFAISLISFGLFSDFFANLVLTYGLIPLQLSLIIFVPFLAGAIYAVIKALPTT